MSNQTSNTTSTLTERQEFDSYFRQLRLRHFDPEELLIGTSKAQNCIPPRELWDNFVMTIVILDELRAHFGVPLILTSVYRCADYNRLVSSSSKLSQHQAFTAADFHVRGVSARNAANVLKEWVSQKKEFSLPASITRRGVACTHGSIPFRDIQTKCSPTGENFTLLGGIGCYKNFTHLDTRGIPAQW